MKILHDIHTHSSLSSCCGDPLATVDAYLQKEKELGMRLFGLSNHLWDERVPGASSWYKYQPIRAAKEAKSALRYQNPGLKVLFGAEGEYYGYRDLLGMSVEGAKEFDYVLIPFSHLHMRNEVMGDFPEIVEIRERIRAELTEKLPYIPADQIDVMVNSLKEGNIKKICPDIQINAKPHFQKAMMDNFFGLLNNPEFEKLSKTVPTVIAHSFAFCGVAGALKNDYLSDLPMDRIAEGYRKAAEMGVAIEINLCEVRGVTLDLPNSNLLKIYKVAKEQGCKFTFGTDSHSVSELENRIFMPDGLNLANAVVEEMQLTKNDIAEFVREGIEE